jgi:hypothetical protein
LKEKGVFRNIVNHYNIYQQYSFVNFGIFIFGIYLPTLEAYYFTSIGIVHNQNLLYNGNTEMRMIWDRNKPEFRLTPAWFQFYISRIFMVSAVSEGTQNKCYTWDYIENQNYTTVYDPPKTKNFKHVWMNAVKIYCSTTDNLVYRLGKGNVWIPIIDVRGIVKSSISMDQNNVVVKSSGNLDLSFQTLSLNSSPFNTLLLTRDNFVYECTPNYSSSSILSGNIAPDSYRGPINAFKLIVSGTKAIEGVEMIYIYEVVNVKVDPRNHFQELKYKYAEGSSPHLAVYDIPYRCVISNSMDLSNWTNLKYMCIYYSPLVFS